MLVQNQNRQLELESATFATQYDQLSKEFETARRMLLEVDDENVQLNEQLKVNKLRISPQK